MSKLYLILTVLFVPLFAFLAAPGLAMAQEPDCGSFTLSAEGTIIEQEYGLYVSALTGFKYIDELRQETFRIWFLSNSNCGSSIRVADVSIDEGESTQVIYSWSTAEGGWHNSLNMDTFQNEVKETCFINNDWLDIVSSHPVTMTVFFESCDGSIAYPYPEPETPDPYAFDFDLTALLDRTSDFLTMLWPIIAIIAGVAFAIYLSKLVLSVFKGGIW